MSIEDEIMKLANEIPPELWGRVMCPCCGGKLTKIRGRHPGMPDRPVCAQCVVERLEDLVSSLQGPATAKRA